MATVTTIIEEHPLPTYGTSPSRAVSWPAIFAGATAAAALSLILLFLGLGLGLSSLSPWVSGSSSAERISWGAIAWIICTAFAASGLGGYLTGRMRDRWNATHADEVHFRDTANGFLAWSLATLVTAATLASAAGAILQTGGKVAMAGAAVVASSNTQTTSQSGNDLAYAVDMLFRAPATATGGSTPTGASTFVDDTRSRAEVGRIFDTSQTAATITPEDARYVGQILAQYRGYPQPEAEQRALETFNTAMTKREAAAKRAREATDLARRNAAHASLWIFASLLVGAFSASLMATFGGRQRDLP